MIVFADLAYLPDGWARNVRFTIDAADTIVSVETGVDAGDAVPATGILVPGMANVHSHAFQHALAGRAERRSASGDDFWSWRSMMYELTAELDPDSLRELARVVYRGMARGGYTSVCEFHYVHRDRSGRWYAEKDAMARALIEAARSEGLAICLLPALYAQAAPGGAPLAAEQRRFASGVDDILDISRTLRSAYRDDPNVSVGVCIHSLRAASPDDLRRLLEASPRDVPVHLHIAEQQREVDEFRHVYGANPIAWLLENFEVDRRWCLVHATRATARELEDVARLGAVVGLCPTTEAHLGDGIFPYDDFARCGGRFGIGSDSNVALTVPDELRLLEFGQRLFQRRRLVIADPGRTCGETLYARAAEGGGAVSGFALGTLAPGKRARFLTLPWTGAAADIEAFDGYLFGAGTTSAAPSH